MSGLPSFPILFPRRIPGEFGNVPAPETPWYRAGGAPEPIAAYRAIGASSYASALVNLISPGSHDKFSGTAPTWDAINGMKYTTLQYLKSDLVPANGWSFIARITNAPSPNNDYLCLGTFLAGNNSFGFAPSRAAGVYYYNGGVATKAPAATNGTFGVLGTSAYRNGVKEPTTVIPGWGGVTTHPIYFGGYNNAGAPQPGIAVYQQAEVFWDENHTPTEAQFLEVMAEMMALSNP